MFSYTYSSEDGRWSEPTTTVAGGVDVSWDRSALVGNQLYFVVVNDEGILKYHLGTRQISFIEIGPPLLRGVTPRVTNVSIFKTCP